MSNNPHSNCQCWTAFINNINWINLIIIVIFYIIISISMIFIDE